MSILNDAIQGALPELRQMAESMMTLTLRVYEPTTPTKDADGYDVPAYIDHGTVAGKVQSGSSQGKDTATRYVSIGDVERPVLEAGLHIPTTAFLDSEGKLLVKAGWQLGLGWEFLITAVNDLADTALLGRRYLVGEVPAKSFATARRLTVVEL